MTIPHTVGDAPPQHAVPPDACDCHMHFYDDAFPALRPASRLVSNAGVTQYRKLQNRLGTSRVVVVQPAPYVNDNTVTLAAIAEIGNARGVAVIHPDVTDAELQRLNAGGIRGIRFSIFDPRTAAVSFDMIAPLAARMNALGWHVQLHLRGDQIVEHEKLIEQLPCPMVFDHLGRIPQPEGIQHPAFAIIQRLLKARRAWVKLSGAYADTKVGAPSYSDAVAMMRAYVATAPERCVFGSDWPHPTEAADHKPDDARLIDLIAEAAPDEAVRRKILVDNPAKLYGF
ncbi:4-sulfomuconolactone hydrolase [Variibacter gotjawalensis]|uniref:4-sulfomuconolactone hydrolase n=1 Tax=Variibacter gotjawalensis TaxID=1333996 RepID=A0A0S3PT37_9BRAD|nr:amidohydrolase family protein [Variibacter gotjawalensis]NIK49395.1 putative TIM-barrel fold metal-dependent hydrolase [Variibacter gotjawalensis]RZS51247.1 putative TIM-barrel fold metal-dependent hydrolase [Variibacter gotjawalensis]BAT59080.1 4-sulfomuconolactone hydrolase [Variibacter gotjawalensis]